MTNTIVSFGEGMKYVKLITIILIVLSLAFLGCVKAPVATPTPTATPTATETVKPTAVPTTVTPTPTPARVPAVYKVDVDDILGFYRVRLITSTTPPIYNNYTLNINTGDKVIWISESEDYTITIVSEQGLWDNTSAKLRWNYQQFNYTFEQPGTYGVYLMEFPKVKHQKIVVTQ
jgi:plastocyanin